MLSCSLFTMKKLEDWTGVYFLALTVVFSLMNPPTW